MQTVRHGHEGHRSGGTQQEVAIRRELKETEPRTFREWLDLLNSVRRIPFRNCGGCGPTPKQRKLYVETIQVGIRDLLVSRSMGEDRMHEMQFEHQRWFEILEAELNPSGNARTIWKCDKGLIHSLLHVLEIAVEINSHLEEPHVARQRKARLNRDRGRGSGAMNVACFRKREQYGT